MDSRRDLSSQLAFLCRPPLPLPLDAVAPQSSRAAVGPDREHEEEARSPFEVVRRCLRPLLADVINGKCRRQDVLLGLLRYGKFSLFSRTAFEVCPPCKTSRLSLTKQPALSEASGRWQGFALVLGRITADNCGERKLSTGNCRHRVPPGECGWACQTPPPPVVPPKAL